jgi:lysophospholipase L1-like esterase
LVRYQSLLVLLACVALLGLVTGFFVGFGFARYRYDLTFSQRTKWRIFSALYKSAERKLLLVGDSRVVALSCPAAFSGWRILNLGVSGSTAGQTLDLLKPNLAYFGKFEAAIIWTGINDVRFGRDAESVIDNIVAVLDLLASSSRQVLLLGQFPMREDDPAAEKINRVLQIINHTAAARTAARGQHFMLPQVTNGKPELYADAIHLNDRGNQLVCAEIGQWLANRIEK